MNFRLLCIFSALLLVAACATPYQRTGFAGGYSESPLAKNVWQITARGNGFTSEDRIQAMLTLRAAELTLENGYQKFEIVGGDGVHTETAFAGYTGGTSTTTGMANASVYGNMGTVYGQSTTTYDPPTPVFTHKPRGMIVVKMFKARDREVADALDASTVVSNLRLQFSN